MLADVIHDKSMLANIFVHTAYYYLSVKTIACRSCTSDVCSIIRIELLFACRSCTSDVCVIINVQLLLACHFCTSVCEIIHVELVYMIIPVELLLTCHFCTSKMCDQPHRTSTGHHTCSTGFCDHSCMRSVIKVFNFSCGKQFNHHKCPLAGRCRRPPCTCMNYFPPHLQVTSVTECSDHPLDFHLQQNDRTT